MSTTTEQTYEQAAEMLNKVVGLAANFTDGVMKGIERGGSDAAVALSEIRLQYQRERHRSQVSILFV